MNEIIHFRRAWGAMHRDLLHVLEPGVLERVATKVVRAEWPKSSCGAIMRFASRGWCLGIVDRTARVVSDDCSSSASVAGRDDCCFRHSKFDKLTSYTLADRGIRRERPQKRKEQMADNAV